MTESRDIAERLYELRSRYLKQFDSVHPLIAELSPPLQVRLLESALSHGLVIDAASTERALGEIRSQVAGVMRQGGV